MVQRRFAMIWPQAVCVVELMSLPATAAEDPNRRDLNTLPVDSNEPAQNGSPFVVAPLFVTNPAFGNGFGILWLYFYRPQLGDGVSLQSAVGAFGLHSDTDSYFTALL